MILSDSEINKSVGLGELDVIHMSLARAVEAAVIAKILSYEPAAYRCPTINGSGYWLGQEVVSKQMLNECRNVIEPLYVLPNYFQESKS